ncbi:MAG: tetratricopeptide repeat protein, partial [Luteimonas sp.]
QVAGNAAANSGNDAAAADYFAKAIAANGLGNNDHYTVMYNLTATQYGLGQNEQALKTLDGFLAETKSDKLEMLKLRGGILMQLDRNTEAAEVFNKLLAAHPDDKALRLNAVAAYQQAEQPEKAMALLSEANAKGMLTSANEYRALYVSYINADRDKEALALIDEGIAKGVVQPDADLAKVYMVIGQKAYYADHMAVAIDMYKRAAPIAEDGEAALNLAKILFETGKKAEAKAAAQQALEKGVKDAAQAKRFIGGG